MRQKVANVLNLSCQTKDCYTGICWFSAKHAPLRSKSKNLFARSEDNVSK